MEYYR
jgi:hypothetical protein